MRIQEEDKIEMKKLSNKIYTPYISLNNNERKKFIKCSKIFFSVILFVILLIIITFIIKNRNKYLKVNLSIKAIDKKINEKNFLNKLKSILGKDEIFENEMMDKHTTFQLGGPAKVFIIPKSINKLLKIIRLCREYSFDYFILGNGSNLLVSDQGFKGIVINI
jgi:UDP-N-acetylmuramate dehydrogenase